MSPDQILSRVVYVEIVIWIIWNKGKQFVEGVPTLNGQTFSQIQIELEYILLENNKNYSQIWIIIHLNRVRTMANEREQANPTKK